MTWRGPALDREGQDVLALLDDVLRDASSLSDDRPAEVVAARSQLAELGLWTVGIADSLGGGGADREVTLLTLERLGRIWPAVGWACAQAHAAVEILGADDRFASLVDSIHDASAPVVVVDEQGDHVRLEHHGARVTGTIDRVDPAGESPTVIVLDAAGATVLPPAGLAVTPVARTGLGGAGTVAVVVDVPEAERLDTDVTAARAWLHLGAAAVAAGIAGGATDDALDYAQLREQFGGPLTDLPTVRASLHHQAASTSTVLAAVLGVDAAEPTQTAGVLASACDSAIDVAAQALQAHGGYGYLTEYAAERLLRDAVSLRAAADPHGAAVAAARTLVGLPTDDPRKDRS